MARLSLNLGEKIIMDAPRGVTPQNDELAKKYYVSLVLTNKALYIQYLSIWTGAVKETRRIPLVSFSIYEGKAQVHTRKAGIYYSLVLYTRDETFEFVMAGSSKDEVTRWADTIARILTGQDSKRADDENTGYLENVKGLFNAFTNSRPEPVMDNVEEVNCTYTIDDEDKDDGNDSLDDQIELVKKLKELLDLGALTQEEFEKKKKEILGL